MTLNQLREAVLSALGDSGNTTGFYRPADADAALNAAQTIFALGSFCIERSADFTIPAGDSFAVMPFTDLIVPFTLRIDGIRAEPNSLADMQADNAYWMDRSDSRARLQRRYAVLGARMAAVYPKSGSAMTARVLYAAAPAPISGSPEIPAEYHPALVQYAVSRLRIKEGGSMMTKDADRMREFWTAVSECADKVRTRCRTNFYDVEPPPFRIPKEKAVKRG